MLNTLYSRERKNYADNFHVAFLLINQIIACTLDIMLGGK